MLKLVVILPIFALFQVFLKDDCPLPTIESRWSNFCRPEAYSWPTRYINRLQQWAIIFPPPDLSHHDAYNPISLDDD